MPSKCNSCKHCTVNVEKEVVHPTSSSCVWRTRTSYTCAAKEYKNICGVPTKTKCDFFKASRKKYASKKSAKQSH